MLLALSPIVIKYWKKDENSLDEKIYMHFYILISSYVITISNELNNGLVQFSFYPWCPLEWSNPHMNFFYSILLALIYSFFPYELGLILITNPYNRLCLLLFYVPLAVLSNNPKKLWQCGEFQTPTVEQTSKFMTCLAFFVYKQRKSLVSIQSRWFKDKHEPARTGQEEIFAMGVDSWGGGAGAGDDHWEVWFLWRHWEEQCTRYTRRHRPGRWSGSYSGDHQPD